MATEKLDWIKVDPSALPEALKTRWAALAKANAAQKAAREEFEAAFIAASNKAKKVPAGKTVLFGYRFGGLAIAMADKDGETKPSKGAVSWF
jgi:ABC-type hemin transport system substrate-binding protein